MGSSIFAIVANLYMEWAEQTALATSPPLNCDHLCGEDTWMIVVRRPSAEQQTASLSTLTKSTLRGT